MYAAESASDWIADIWSRVTRKMVRTTLDHFAQESVNLVLHSGCRH